MVKCNKTGGDNMNSNKLYQIYGSNAAEMAYTLMEKANVISLLRPDMKIVLKPNLVVAKPSTSGATTSPALVEGVIRYLKEHGCNNIAIMESSWIGCGTKSAFRVCGYEDLSRKYNVPLKDLKQDETVLLQYNGIKINVCKSVYEADFLINLPVLKAHCQTMLTCALKNLKGCIPDSEKRRFHSMGLHTPIAALNKMLKTHLVIVDGIMGDLTFEEGGNPVEMNTVILGTDPVLVDSYAATILGYTPEEIDYIPKAQSFGIGNILNENTELIELNKNFSQRTFKPSGIAGRLANYIEEDSACSACYGSLIHALYRLEERGRLRRFKGKIRIGQGFRGKTTEGIGVGKCTSGCSMHLGGCPPSSVNIMKFLDENIGK